MTLPFSTSERARRFVAMAIDAAAWFIAVVVAVVLRFEFNPQSVSWAWTMALAIAAGALQALVGSALGVYRGRFAYGSFDEIRWLAAVAVFETMVLTAFVLMIGPLISIPRSAIVIAFPFVLIFMFAIRYAWRFAGESQQRPDRATPPALIVGAGALADTLLRLLLTDRDAPIRPVGLLDDDPHKRNLRLRGVAVVGSTAQIAEAARRTGATSVVIAIGYADSALLRRVTNAAESSGLSVYVTPTLTNLIAGRAQVSDLRAIDIEDLIGRNPVDTEVETIAGYVTGRRVLVTGAGGSIGSELCRQLSKFGPSELIMLDRDETGLQLAQLSVSGHGLLHTNDVVLADIRDRATVAQIFATRRPEVVFHAAALKHLPLLEQYPDEAWQTNVLGTLHVLEAARAVGVTTFVNISTDKAANPTSVLGHSKRVAEKLTSWAAEVTQLRYLSVRFGNVIGSRGSMLPTFQALIDAGGPLTVTHPDVTRYFMTIPEACQLVVQAGGIGRPGEVLILDMGEPVRILDVAKRMIDMSGRNVEIVFTGLREGEKLHEELVGSRESLERPFHPKIAHTRADAISPERLDKAGWKARIMAQRRVNETSVVDRFSREGDGSVG